MSVLKGDADDAAPTSIGAQIRARAQGPRTESVQRVAADLDPDLPNWIDDFVFGTVWARPGLSHEERTFAALVALACGGHTEQLRVYLWGALHDGADPAKVHELLMMVSVYAGFPTALASLFVWREVLEKARSHGLAPEATPGAPPTAFGE
jgi:4-carboxymuconolactone decarboxylase